MRGDAMRERGCAGTLPAGAWAIAVAAALGVVAGCGGVPVEIRFVDATMEFDVDDAVETLEEQLHNLGSLPVQINALPERWPDDLPDVRYTYFVTTPSEFVDLNPDPDATEQDFDWCAGSVPDDAPPARPGERRCAGDGTLDEVERALLEKHQDHVKNFKKFEKINKDVEIVRIELNALVVRVEQNSTNIALPEVAVQIADMDIDEPLPHELDNRAWWTIGTIPPLEPGAVTDLQFQWRNGGESFMNYQLGDVQKKFQVRAQANVVFDTAVNDARPRGRAKVRLIVLATFFAKPRQL
jgi:hypothetical protein